jgi:hypothetical protein
VTIVPVHEPEELAEFIEFPWTVYRNDPLWIPPVREQVLHELSGASAFSRYGRMHLMLCQKDRQTCGRIAALVNPRLLDGNGVAFGQLGYFECADDQEAADALIAAGLKWLRSEGVHTVLAPMNGGAHRTHRFLTRGFDREPFLFEPRNPPYYPEAFERSGFTAANRWFSYELSSRRAASLVERFDSMIRKKPPSGTIRELPLQDKQAAIGRIHRLLDGCWTGHVGYAPFAEEEFAEVFGGVLSIMEPHNLSVFMEGDRDAGCTFVYPDYAAEVRALSGRAAGWGEWLGRARPKRIVLHTAALVPEARKTTAAMAQVSWALREGIRDGFEELIVALAVAGFVSKIGDQTREYTLYSRSLD